MADDDIRAIREKLGISSSVPDSDIKMLMKTKTGKDELKKAEAQPAAGGGNLIWGAGGLGALVDPIAHALAGAGKSAYEGTLGKLTPGARALALSGIDPGVGLASLSAGSDPGALKGVEKDIVKQTPEDTKKPKSKDKTDSTKLPSPETAATSPFTELTQQLAQEYLAQVQQLESLTSGQEGTTLAGQAQTAAQTNLGNLLKQYAPGLPASVTGAASNAISNVPADPMAGALTQSQQAEANAQSAGALGMAGAIGNMGTAEAETLASAPYSSLLNELASETAYRASNPEYGASALGLTTANTPQWLQTILKNIGVPATPVKGSGSTTTAPTVPSATKAASSSTSVPSDSSNPASP
jgi:hypothetical protein